LIVCAVEGSFHVSCFAAMMQGMTLGDSHDLTPQIDCIDPTLRGIGIHFVAPLEEYICRVWVDNSVIRDLESSHD
jgi:hypothetical protein